MIAWQVNNSVPMAYQDSRAGVAEHHGQLHISDLSTGEIIAEHIIRLKKGQIVKNTDHYRDKAQRIAALETDISQLLGNTESADALCALLKASAPNIYIVDPEKFTRLLI